MTDDKEKIDVAQWMGMIYHPKTKDGVLPRIEKHLEKLNGTVAEHTKEIANIKKDVNGFKWIAVKIGGVFTLIGGVLVYWWKK